MKDGLLLDTHVWVWIANGTLHPAPELLQRLNSAAARDAIYLSAISLYEIAHAVCRARLNLVRPLDDWFATNLQRPGPRIIELTPALAVETTKLPKTFHGDPGDRMIAATAAHLGLTLVTHDKALLRFSKQGLFASLAAKERRSTP